MNFIVFTRFGLYVDQKDWYRHQVDVFYKYLYPSLKYQTDQDFTLILGYDEYTPNDVVDDLEAKLELCGFHYHLVRYKRKEQGRFPKMGSLEWLYEEALDKIGRKNLFDSADEYYISASIDADDAWDKELVSFVKAFFSERSKEIKVSEEKQHYQNSPSGGAVLTLPVGYFFFEDSKSLIEVEYPYASLNNFVVTRLYSGVSCFSLAHPNWQRGDKVFGMVSYKPSGLRPMWFHSKENISRNIRNKYKFEKVIGPVDADYVAVLNNFGMDSEELSGEHYSMAFAKHFDPQELQNNFFLERFNYLSEMI